MRRAAMTKEEVRRAVKARLDRWKIPMHCALIRNETGGVVVEFIGHGKRNVVKIQTNNGQLMTNEGLRELDLMIRARADIRLQSDVEDFTT